MDKNFQVINGSYMNKFWVCTNVITRLLTTCVNTIVLSVSDHGRNRSGRFTFKVRT